MTVYVCSYLATALVFFGLDFIWLTVTGDTLYRPILGDMMAAKFKVAPAAIFYVLYIAGIVIFAVSAALDSGRWTTALVRGALFGLFAYATYDLTNQATLKNWSTTITLADIGWGTALTGTSATIGYLIVRALPKAIAR